MKFCLLALLGALAISTANAVEVTALYTAQVALDQEQRDPRAAAYSEALRQVILRVSGSELLQDEDLYEALFPDPSVYVLQFRPGNDDTLFVSFDGNAIENTLRAAGQTVWGGDRPLTLVWLAVDWGQGEREIVAAADSEQSIDAARSVNRNRQLRERILEIANSRGLPVLFPLLDSEDMANVEFSDIWGGFDERVLAASKRYDVNSVLIGRVRANGTEQNRWTYLFSDVQRNWTGEPEYVITQVSDLMATQFAIGGDEPLRAVDLSISGVQTVEGYGEVQQMLANINVIEALAITEVAGDRIRYRVTAHGGAERLARALRFEGLIEQDRIAMGGADDGPRMSNESLEFFYQP